MPEAQHGTATGERTAVAGDGKDVTASIYDQLSGAIFDRRLPPGTKLVEQNLGAIFGVSRARIRSVLGRLAHDHLVTLERNRGARVSTPGVDEAREVFEARKLIEDGTVRAAAHNATPAQMRALRAHVDDEAETRRQGDRQAGIRLSGRFHLLLAEAGGNQVLLGLLRGLVARSSLVIALYERPGQGDCSNHDHQGLLDRVAAGDADGAAAGMAAHLDEIRGQLDLSAQGSSRVSLESVFGGLE
jgi:DNA-binding GntR family transcriptional regulator